MIDAIAHNMLDRCQNGRDFCVVEKEWKAVRTADEEAHAPDPSASLQLYITRQVVHMASLDLDESRVL